ncbi:MAG: mechanosensitive ion channel family protein [Gemmatimonadota bacterium]
MLENFDVSALFPVLLDIVGALVLLLVTVWVAAWARRVTQKGLERGGMDPTLTKFAGQHARYGVLILGGIAVLSVFGINVASFAAILAAAGFAIGMALQGTLGNFSSGAMLLIFRPFKVGDVVSVAGITGKVVEIALFSTQFDTPDNRRIIVPNGEIYGSTIENITFHPTRRVDVDVGTDYGADLRATRAALERVAAEAEGVLQDPPPQVYLKELGGSSIDWAVRAWALTPDYWAVRERITQSIKEALDAAEIGIPFPQMDVHVDGIPAVAPGAEAGSG